MHVTYLFDLHTLSYCYIFLEIRQKWQNPIQINVIECKAIQVNMTFDTF